MRARVFLLLIVVMLIALGYGLQAGHVVIPDRWNPWAPLKIDEPLHWLTRLKLARLSREPALCLSVLEQADMRFKTLADGQAGAGCELTNAVRIEGTSASVGQPFTLSCRTAVALALWEYHFVQAAARAHYGERVARLEHAGSYACRNIYGRKDAPLSRHATADAIDISGFVLEKGRRVRVARDWGSSDADGVFLREVHDGACRVFDAVLGPDYNAAHRDHFHLDRGGWRVCR